MDYEKEYIKLLLSLAELILESVKSLISEQKEIPRQAEEHTPVRYKNVRKTGGF